MAQQGQTPLSELQALLERVTREARDLMQRLSHDLVEQTRQRDEYRLDLAVSRREKE